MMLYSGAQPLLKKKPFRFRNTILLLIALSGILNGVLFKWKDDQWKRIITSDGKGYYLYLPAAFVYHDFDFHFVHDIEMEHFGFIGQLPYYQKNGDDRLDKYYGGVALLMLPFFLMAHALSLIFGFPPDGYSFLYQCSISIAALFYGLAGLCILSEILKKRGVSDQVNGLLLLLVFAATPLVYYTLMEPSMSHVYSFFLFCWFIYTAEIFLQNPSKSRWWLIMLIAGLITFVRPTNIIIALYLPLRAVFGSGFQFFFAFVKTHFLHVILSVSVLCLPMGLQALLYFLQVGEWWVYAYGEEGFNFTKPEIFNLLFSFRKGWFTYTPSMFLCCLVLMVLFVKRNRMAIVCAVLLGIGVYITASWHQWYYGGSFGMRALTEYGVLAILPLALDWKNMSRITHLLLSLGLFLTLLINLVQLYQVTHYILPMDGMNRTMYKRLFMQTSSAYAGFAEYSNNPVIPPEYVILSEIKDDFSSENQNWSGVKSLQTDVDGNRYCRIDAKQDFGPITGITLSDSLWLKSPELYVRIRMQVKLSSLRSRALAVVSVENNGPALQWHTRPLVFSVPACGKWVPLSYDFKLNPGIEAGFRLNTFILKEDKLPVAFDNFSYQLYGKKP